MDTTITRCNYCEQYELHILDSCKLFANTTKVEITLKCEVCDTEKQVVFTANKKDFK